MAAAYPSSSTGSSTGNSVPQLSEKAMEIVFQHLQDDPVALLNCKKTCKAWDNAITKQQTTALTSNGNNNFETDSICSGISDHCKISQ